MSAKKLPRQFDNYDPEKIGLGIAGIAKEIVKKDAERKKTTNTERTQREHRANTFQAI